MALTPDPRWRVPARTWQEVIDRYVHFRRVKGWKGRTHAADGTINPNRLPKSVAERLRRTIWARVSPLLEQGSLPDSAFPLRQQAIDILLRRASCVERRFDRAPRWLQHLWRALILNRDGYTCRYCGRTAWGTHRDLGATVRFELDHRRAKAHLGSSCDDFDIANIRLACRSCNVVKGQMTRQQFFKEARSLASAFASLRPALGSVGQQGRSNFAVHRTGARVARSGR